jgi:hypothetical protein
MSVLVTSELEIEDGLRFDNLEDDVSEELKEFILNMPPGYLADQLMSPIDELDLKSIIGIKDNYIIGGRFISGEISFDLFIKMVSGLSSLVRDWE